MNFPSHNREKQDGFRFGSAGRKAPHSLFSDDLTNHAAVDIGQPCVAKAHAVQNRGERAPEPWFGPLRIRSLGSLEQLLPSGWPPSSFSAESLGVGAIATFFLAIDADRLGV